MRVLQVTEFGDPSALKVAELPEPTAGKNDILIRVEGVGVGYFDGLLIKGEYQIKPPLPFVPGSSIAGVVEQVGDNVTGLAVGDPVVSFAFLGGLAEKMVIPARSAVPLPTDINLQDASNFFMAYATAVLGLHTLGDVKAGETVMVLGASGTTGTAAIEVAKAKGAVVIACASTDAKREQCVAMGADHTVDYTRDDWRKAVKKIAPMGVDVVYDPIGGRWAEPALRSMAAGGRYLIVGFVDGIASIPLNLPLLKRCAVMGVNWGAESMANPAIVPEIIRHIIQWTQEGKLKTRPEKVYTLSEGGEAFAKLFDRTSMGKIVINPNGE